MHFFCNETKLYANVMKKPFKLQRTATSDQFLGFDLTKKNNITNAINSTHQRDDAADAATNFCKDLLTVKSKS